MTEADLLRALCDCYDPRTRRNVVEGGLVRRVSLEQDTRAPGAGIPGIPSRYIAQIEMTAPGNDDLLNGQVKAQIENRLAGLPSISRTEIVMRPPLFAIL